jgi:molybdopterin converting factor small subunit
MMRISVKFTSQLKVLAGREEVAVELEEGASVAELLGSLRESSPALFPLAEHTVIMVGHRHATPETKLHEGDQVMLLQILSGG